MIGFCLSLLCLVLGYFLYGTFVEKVFGVDPGRKTPCYTHADGSDYIPMPTWKVYTVQFLNIAGTAPYSEPSWECYTVRLPFCG